MKIIYVLSIFFLIQNFAYTQNLNGRVLDSISQKPLELANVTFIKINSGTSTDSKGNFVLSLKIPEDYIKISSIGYTSKVVEISKYRGISYDSLKIYLVPRVEHLEEIIIAPKIIDYTSSIKLGLDKKLKVRTGFPFGYEFSNLIKNSSGRRGQLQSVIISLNEKKEFDYIATYNIRFYEYDAIRKLPGEEIYYSNVIVEPKNRTYKLRIDVSKLKIPFPESGICIGVEIINTRYDDHIKSMSEIAPYINFTHTDKEILTWTRYRSKDWVVGTSKSHVRKDFINAMINVEVKLEK